MVDFNQKNQTHVAVYIIPPRRWWKRAHYKLAMPVTIGGHEVPKGFVTDGASSPRFLWPIFPPIGQTLPAAILHDWLLTNGYSWKYSNIEFSKALKQQKISAWRRWLIMSGVRLWAAFSKEPKDQKLKRSNENE